MNPSLIDISVLLLFHARADHFSQVWAEVKKARPARLFLYQDGPRGERDMPGILACRALVADEEIDWECEVHRLYQERNYGCDPSEYISQRWAFSLTDKCIVLEDDDVPSQSFFPFCKEMLDRYEHDPRVMMVAGFNTDEESLLPAAAETGKPADYFFTSVMSIWGWASWARVVNNWDGAYHWLDDPESVAHIEAIVRERKVRDDFMRTCRRHKASGKEHYETIFWSHLLLNNGLAVMPRLNLINNIGVDGGTHYSGSLATTPCGLRRIFTMKRHELNFPLQHPQHVCEWMPYKLSHYRTNAWGHPCVKVARSFEELFLNLRYANFRFIGRSIMNRLRKTIDIIRNK